MLPAIAMTRWLRLGAEAKNTAFEADAPSNGCAESTVLGSRVRRPARGCEVGSVRAQPRWCESAPATGQARHSLQSPGVGLKNRLAQAARALWHPCQRKEHVVPLLGIERFEDIFVIAFRQIEDRAKR